MTERSGKNPVWSGMISIRERWSALLLLHRIRWNHLVRIYTSGAAVPSSWSGADCKCMHVQGLTDYADRAIVLALTAVLLALLPSSVKAAVNK